MKCCFFNVNFNKHGKVKIGSGSDKDYLNIMMTSTILMKNCQIDRVFHVDGTYKITENGFLLVVFGISNIQRVSNFISCMLTSHETELDHG